MAILLNNDGFWHEKWRAAIETHMPSLEIFEFPDIPDPTLIEYALIWGHPEGDLERYPNLKVIYSLGSGVDYLDAYTALPAAPIFRTIDMNMADDMALYTLYWTIHFQRLFNTYRTQQEKGQWTRYPTPLAHEYKVTILGLGAIGGHIAKALARNGFDVTGWSRRLKDIDDINCVSGDGSLNAILPQTDVLVCALPLTKATYEYLDISMLKRLKKGAAFINISRGAVVNEVDLLTLLDSGHIHGAALDVFHTEPLPKNSPFWTHPNVHVTPHMSGPTNPHTAMQTIAKELANFEKGIMPPYPYKRETVS